MESNEKKLSTNFSVSNADVITMLVVKNRENLNKQREEHRLVYVAGVKKLSDEIKQKWEKYISKKFEKNEIVDTYQKLLKLLNPKAKFELDLGIKTVSESIEYTISSVCSGSREYYGAAQKNGEYEFEIKTLYILPEFSDNEEGSKEQGNFHYISSGDYGEGGSGLQIDVKFKAKYKVPDVVKEASNKIYEIDKLLKDEKTLKEKLIAQVTENAIKQMPELQSLVKGTDFLALGE